MVRPVDPNSYTPVHVQVSDDLRDQIRTGHYAPGDVLPTIEDLAHAYHVGIATVRRALATLAAEHLIRTVRGHQAEVIEQQERRVEILEGGDELIVRPADEEDRRRLGLAPGALVAEVTHPDGKTEVFPATQVRFRVPTSGS